MDMQEDITSFQTVFQRAVPVHDGRRRDRRPLRELEEEMQSKITFAGGAIDLDTFHHENMHPVVGDNVSEANYNLTFFKEGLATLGEFFFAARNAQTAAGGRARRPVTLPSSKSLV